MYTPSCKEKELVHSNNNHKTAWQSRRSVRYVIASLSSMCHIANLLRVGLTLASWMYQIQYDGSFWQEFISCSCESRAICEKLKLLSFRYPCPHAWQVNCVSIQHYFNLSSVLTPIEACQWVCLWWPLLRQIGKSKCYASTDKQTGQWHRAESRSNCLHKRPGHEALSLAVAMYLFSPYKNKESRLPYLFVDNSRHVLMSRFQVHWLQKFLKSGLGPVVWKFAPTKLPTIWYHASTKCMWALLFYQSLLIWLFNCNNAIKICNRTFLHLIDTWLERWPCNLLQWNPA